MSQTTQSILAAFDLGWLTESELAELLSVRTIRVLAVIQRRAA